MLENWKDELEELGTNDLVGLRRHRDNATTPEIVNSSDYHYLCGYLDRADENGL